MNNNNQAIRDKVEALQRYLDLRTTNVNNTRINFDRRENLWDLGFTDEQIFSLIRRDNRRTQITIALVAMLRELREMGLTCSHIVDAVTPCIDIAPEKIQAAKTIVKAWCRYRDKQMNFYKLAADSVFMFQGQEYSTVCPISLEVMRNPQILTTREAEHEYKHVVDESAIKSWFKRSKTNPFNKLLCDGSNLTDFTELKAFIQQECETNARGVKRCRLGL